MVQFFGRSSVLRTLLRLFFSRPGERFYAREVERLTGEPMGALQRQLIRLEKEGLLKTERVGPLKYYSMNPDHPYLPELQSLILKGLRQERLKKNLKKILKTLKEKYHPEKVILYGSYATGKIHPDSDLDLLIVKKDVPDRYWDRINELSPIMPRRDVGVDYVIWKPEEIERATDNLFLHQEILGKGRVVYEKRV